MDGDLWPPESFTDGDIYMRLHCIDTYLAICQLSLNVCKEMLYEPQIEERRRYTYAWRRAMCILPSLESSIDFSIHSFSKCLLQSISYCYAPQQEQDKDRTITV
ncbi:hypothetical protein BRADI_2g62523v3 [Brachypodium distachyon]|uniref:Uncharacterized protein n=1 Tax=Brachypodium distachyon TaxID=15368 RepID=A0A2K2DHD8_BRADI|nr:hypothetical protein BRADI_2g62523v3 [Brachypodium distachyon]